MKNHTESKPYLLGFPYRKLQLVVCGLFWSKNHTEGYRIHPYCFTLQDEEPLNMISLLSIYITVYKLQNQKKIQLSMIPNSQTMI